MKVSQNLATPLRVSVMTLLLLAAGCSGQSGNASHEEAAGSESKTSTKTQTSSNAAPETMAKQAVATFASTVGHDVHGTAQFASTEKGVRVTVHVEGLTPGKHGFHVHENGDCSAADATSAGGHFNPGDHPHGGPGNAPARRHVGDLGNILADENGVADMVFVDDVITLEGEHSIVGKAIIVHSGEDDLSSQPTGAAGSRVACGVIEPAMGHEASR